MQKRKKMITVEEQREKAMPEPERVIHLAEMGLSVRQIAIEIGRSEEFVRNNYRKEMQEGFVRAGTIARKVAWNKALRGNRMCLLYFMAKFNHELLPAAPAPVKGASSRKKAPSRSAGSRFSESGERQRGDKGRFKSSEFESESQ